MKSKPTTGDHIKMAKELHKAGDHLNKIFDKIQECYPKKSKLFRLIKRLAPGFFANALETLRCELDEEYHRVTNDADFKKHGHIYYNREALKARRGRSS